MPLSYTSIQDVRLQLTNNAKFAYHGAHMNFLIVTGGCTATMGSKHSADDSANRSCHGLGADLRNLTMSEPHSSSKSSIFGHSVGAGETETIISDNPLKDSSHFRALQTSKDVSENKVSKVPSTWAALISRPWQPRGSDEEDSERLLLKTPSLETELEAVLALHELVKIEVSKRIATLVDRTTMPEAAKASANLLARIPSGWALELNDEAGMVYFVDHSTKTTQWQMPGYAKIKAIKQVVSKHEACTDEASAVLRSLLHTSQDSPVEKED